MKCENNSEMDMAHDVPLLFENPTITSIAKKHDKEPSQILLRWATQHKVAVIPKSNNPDRLAQNLDVCSFDLPKEDLEAIDALDKHLRFNDPLAVSIHPSIFVLDDTVILMRMYLLLRSTAYLLLSSLNRRFQSQGNADIKFKR